MCIVCKIGKNTLVKHYERVNKMSTKIYFCNRKPFFGRNLTHAWIVTPRSLAFVLNGKNYPSQPILSHF